jgi:hypothetical protein
MRWAPPKVETEPASTLGEPADSLIAAAASRQARRKHDVLALRLKTHVNLAQKPVVQTRGTRSSLRCTR